MKLDYAKLLRIVMTVGGAFCVLALVGVFMPMSLMDRTHRAMGLGPLPTAPIVEYLARALSGFYALIGGLLILLARDVHRYRAVIAYVAVAWLAMVCVIFVYGFGMGRLFWYVLGDFVTMMPFGLAMLILLYLAARQRNARAD